MNSTLDVLEKLGVKVPKDWTVDAIHLLETHRLGWHVTMLAWDNSQQHFVIAEVPAGAESTPELVFDPMSHGDTARRLYLSVTTERVFCHYNSKAPGFTFLEPNEAAALERGKS